MLKGKQYDKENAEILYGGWKLLINQWKADKIILKFKNIYSKLHDKINLLAFF